MFLYGSKDMDNLLQSVVRRLGLQSNTPRKGKHARSWCGRKSYGLGLSHLGPPVELAPSLLNMFDTMAANNTERRFSEDSQAGPGLDNNTTIYQTNGKIPEKENAVIEDNALTTKMKRLSENVDTYIDADGPETIVSDINMRPLSCSSTCSSASSASTTSRTSLGNKKYLTPCSSVDSHSPLHNLQIDEESLDCLPNDLKLKMDYENKELSNSLSSAASGRSSQDLTYIDRVIQEVLETERTYVKDLSEIIEGYLYYIRGNSDVRASPEELRVLFGNIEIIYKFNRSFLEELEHCEEDPVQIAQRFVNHTEGFASYSEYCTNYPRTVSVLTELMRRKETADMFKERQAKLRHGLPLGSYLLKPVQRILKYHLFLQNIVKHYEKEKPGYEDILKALSTMTGIAKHINDMKRKHEHAVRVQEIQSLLYDWEGQDLTTYGELVLEGSFRIVGAKALRLMFLFDKVLLIVKKKEDGTFSCKAHITCDNLMLIESVPGEPLSFHVIPFDNPRLQYTVQARTLEQKKEWTLQLKRLILENYGVSIPLHARQLVMELGLKEPEVVENRTENIKRQYSAPEYLLDKRKQRRKSESSLNKTLKMKKGTKKGDITSPKSSPPSVRRQAVSRDASPTHTTEDNSPGKPERRKSEPGPQVPKLHRVDINISKSKPPENKPVPLAEGEDGDDEDEEEEEDNTTKAILLESANGAKSFDDACPRAKRMSLVLEEEGFDALNPNLGWDRKILQAVMSSITVKRAENFRSTIVKSLPTSPQRTIQRDPRYDDEHIYDNLTFNNSRHANSTASIDIKPKNHSSGEYVTLVFSKPMPQVIHNTHAKSSDSLDGKKTTGKNAQLICPKMLPRKQNSLDGNPLLKQRLTIDQRSMSDPNGDLDKPGRWQIPKTKRTVGQYDNLSNIWQKSQKERQGNSDTNLQDGNKMDLPVRRVNSFNNTEDIKRTSTPSKPNFQPATKSLVFSNALALRTPESLPKGQATSTLSQHTSHQKVSGQRCGLPNSAKSGSLPRSFEICRETTHPRCVNCSREPTTSVSSDTFHSEPCSPHKQPIYENVRMRGTPPSWMHNERPVTIASDRPHVNPEFLHDFENYIKNSPSPKTSPVNRFPVQRDDAMHSSYSNTPSDSSEHLHSHSTSSSTEGLVGSIRHVIANVGSRIANIKANISPHSDFWGQSTEDESQEDLREARKHKEKERRVNKLIYSLARAYGQMLKLKHKYKGLDAKESERIASQLTALLEENKQGSSAIGARMARPIELDYSIPRQRPPRPKKQSKDCCLRPDSIVSETSNFTLSGEGESASRESRVSLGIGTSVTSDSSPNLDEVDETVEQERGLEGSSDSSGLSADSYYERSFEALENFLENEMFRDSAIYSDPEDLDAMFLVAAESTSMIKDDDEVEIEDICEDDDPETKAIIHETVKTFEEKIKPLIINKLEIKAKVRSQGILERLKILEENAVYRKEAASPELALSPELPIKSIRERWKELEEWSKGTNRQKIHLEERKVESKIDKVELKSAQETKDQTLAKGWVKLVVGKFQGDSEA